MEIAKAYEDFLVSISEGMCRQDAIERACFVWNVSEKNLVAYVELWEQFK